MKQTDGFNTSNSYKPSYKKYSAIQNYLRKISQIKNDTQANQNYKRTHNYCQSNFPASLTDLNQTYGGQSIFQKLKIEYPLKKRCFSMKSQIPPEIPTSLNEAKISTVYNQKFNLKNINIRENLFQESSQSKKKNRTQMKNFHHKAFYDTNLSKKTVLTEPNETFFGSFQSQAKLNTTFSENRIQRQDSLEKIETAKKQIIQKIRLYVRDLDQKGEDQLNEMLTNQYRKRIRFHNDAYRYENKIKEMILTNKQIVKLLKQELLTERNLPNNDEKVNLSQPYILMGKQMISPEKKFIIDQLEQNVPEKRTENSSFQAQNNEFQNNDPPDSIQAHQKSKRNNHDQEVIKEQQYENELHHVTKQFQSEWKKSQTHKKAMYQKFRSTIFQKYPEIRRRERAIKGKNKVNANLSPYSDDQNSQINIETNRSKELRIESKIKSKFVSNPLESKKESFHSKIQSSPQKQSIYHSLRITTAGQEKQKFEKTLKLSKKNSISKGSTRRLDLLSSQNKQEVAKINFQNLVEFIFNRAFFYSVSKKQVIQNKVPYGQMQYTPRVEKKDPNISFILYNRSINEKRHLKTEKLNQKKLRATGNFLIKNKYKIMSLEKEGNKSFDFLRKCLDDAVQDYLRGTKSK